MTEFSLHLMGGNKGLMENDENLCAASRYAAVKMAGQNGKDIAAHTAIRIALQQGRGSQAPRKTGEGGR